MTDARRPIGEVHVDWDDPHVIRTGATSFYLLPDPADPDAPPTVLGDGWVEVGYTRDDDTLLLDTAALPTVTLEIPAVSTEMTALLYGDPPARSSALIPPTHRVEIDYLAPPAYVAAPGPRKRRGLTGKAYRAARRAYARRRRAWVRAGSPMEQRRIVVPHARIEDR